MQSRYQHRQEVAAFLQRHLTDRRWELALPSSGRGHETYVARSNGDSYFIKLGACLAFFLERTRAQAIVALECGSH